MTWWMQTVCVVGLVLVVAWLAVQAVADWALSRAQRADHERFWGDGATDDGSWANGLRGRFGPAVEDTGSVEATATALREIHPRDSIGRHRDPTRVKARPHVTTKKNKRLGGAL
jgi:hypothetical protein